MTASYEKYSGKMYQTKNDNIKKTLNRLKGDIIEEYEKKSDVIVDVGIGRGVDLKYYANTNTRKIVGIEPSKESFDTAIGRLHSLRRNNKLNSVRVSLLNGVGEKSWKTGAAALDENSKRYFKRTFDSDNLKADAINFFATIHYMMDTEKDLQGLMSNINRHLKKNGKVVIICLNGEKVHELLKKNNGVYSIKDKEKEILYQVTSKYDHKKKPQQYGSKIEIFFKGVYGLGKGISENIVSTKDLVKLFKSNGFRELLVTEYKNISKEIYKSLLPFEKKIMDIYKLIVLEKN